MITFKQKQYSEEDKNVFLTFISKIEGWKTKGKNLHWSAPAKNIHEYIDSFLEILDKFEDTLAETYMGILGKMGPADIRGVACPVTNAWDWIDVILEDTKKFYEFIPEGTEFVGIKGEVESLIKDEEKYKYLFGLCRS